MSNEEFEKWADEKGQTLTFRKHIGQYESTSTQLMWTGWQARQPEIDALETKNRRLSDSLEAIDLDTKVLVDEIDAKDKTIDDLALQKGILIAKVGRLEDELTQAKAIINELRVLIQNSLAVDRTAPIWEMVKDFERKYKETK